MRYVFNFQFGLTLSSSLLIHCVGLVLGIEAWKKLIAQRVLINFDLK